MREFTLTDDHLTLLRAASLRWDDCDSGAPGIDPKRPYGYSGNVGGEVARVLRWRAGDGSEDEDPAEAAYELHRGTLDALRILVELAEIEPGDYAHDPDIGWFRVDPEVGARRTLAWLKGETAWGREQG